MINSENIKRLTNSTCWLVDATFQSCPSEFYQLFVTKSNIFGTYIPICYILMNNKHQSTYIAALKKLKYLIRSCDMLKYVVCDFEISISNAFISEFKDIKISYCLFHYGQLIWRQIQKLGLTCQYTDDYLFRSYIRMFMCIPFMPIEKRKSCYTTLCKNFREAYIIATLNI